MHSSPSEAREGQRRRRGDDRGRIRSDICGAGPKQEERNKSASSIVIVRGKQPRGTLMDNRLKRGRPGEKEAPCGESEAKRELAQRQELGRRKEEGQARAAAAVERASSSPIDHLISLSFPTLRAKQQREQEKASRQRHLPWPERAREREERSKSTESESLLFLTFLLLGEKFSDEEEREGGGEGAKSRGEN